MIDNKIQSPTAQMVSLLSEAAFTASGYTDDVVDETVTETFTFLRDPDDADSDVLISRTVEYNAGRDVLSKTSWDVANAPTVSDVSTDLDDDKTILKSGTTTLTITGTNFGEADDDLVVMLYVPQKVRAGMITPTSFSNMLRFAATITAVNPGDTEIVATITLSSVSKQEIGSGTVFVEVVNKKRSLRSLFNKELSLI